MRGSWFIGATIVLILMERPAPAEASKKKKIKNQVNVVVREKKRECQTGPCRHLVPLEGQNCVNECISPACYRKTFAEPLEDGEINIELTDRFTQCSRREARSAQLASRRRPPNVIEPDEPADVTVLVEGTGESQSTSAARGSEGISMGGQEGAKDGDSVIDDDDGDIDEDEGYEQGGYLMEDRDMEAMQ